MSVLFVNAHSGMTEALFDQAEAEGKLRRVRQRDLTAAHFAEASGLITTMYLDQVGFLQHGESIQALLGRGGRWIFSGHMLRPPIPSLGIYVPLADPRRSDFALTRLSEHPIFAGIDQKALELNRGVAGFYGRGHNPMPQDATAINGLGPQNLPIDWDWVRPDGGCIFSHAGNDFWHNGDDVALHQVLADRAVAWAAGDRDR
ncbi:hypothetical protein [Dongia sedimenti]|uniref:Uncharacterized protein n=1 Tax=Dongia sedimenti TaxID=3064282 RepID=A0ABU0YQ20_9PROT|nr:hypothetical protein [Rhodospirillaceae bacterium R-7]